MSTLASLHAKGVRGAGTVTITVGGPPDLVTLFPGSSFATDPATRIGPGESVLCVVRYRMDDDPGTKVRGWLIGPRADLWDVAQAFRRYLTHRRARLVRHRRDTGDHHTRLDSLLFHYNPAPCILRRIVADWCDSSRP